MPTSAWVRPHWAMQDSAPTRPAFSWRLMSKNRHPYRYDSCFQNATLQFDCISVSMHRVRTQVSFGWGQRDGARVRKNTHTTAPYRTLNPATPAVEARSSNCAETSISYTTENILLSALTLCASPKHKWKMNYVLHSAATKKRTTSIYT
jgi:hypothetical protein